MFFSVTVHSVNTAWMIKPEEQKLWDLITCVHMRVYPTYCLLETILYVRNVYLAL
jgi:hypothetical protein